jgi:predicted nucleic acid-binding protein
VLYYRDTVIVIYAVEGNPADQQRALNHLAALEQAGHRFAISELTRTEFLVPVFGLGTGQRLLDFFRLFHGPNLQTLTLTAAIHARASAIRGSHMYPGAGPGPAKRYGLADALHLATAIEMACDVFLSNDLQLASFPDITVEVLPRSELRARGKRDSSNCATLFVINVHEGAKPSLDDDNMRKPIRRRFEPVGVRRPMPIVGFFAIPSSSRTA